MKPIYTFDTETDPFLFGRIPETFACGLYDGESFRYEWGKDCMRRMKERIANFPPGIIYVHNGGRFDFYYMLDWFDGKMSIINSRIIRSYGLGHEWRDSYALYPMPLASYKKDDIDYNKLDVQNREENKQEILDYLKGDCVYLHELVSRIIDEFGDNLTIGSLAMKEIKKLHKFDTLDSIQDGQIRDRFYFGGRVQCFEKGILRPKYGDYLMCYDINQSYPTSMRNYMHPIGKPSFGSYDIDDPSVFFVTVSGYSRGCFPVRTDDGLKFPIGYGTFNTSIHEYRTAIECDEFKMDNIIETVSFDRVGCFNEFVDLYHGKRKEEQLKGDKTWSNFYKRVGNSGYGKFSQCPDNYFDYIIKPMGIDVPGYEPDYIIGDVVLWAKESDDVTRYNVATGASITGASRSMLIRALASAKRPLYCDTDSIICEGMGSDIYIDEYKLGAWKLEKYGVKFALAGRKLYALFDADGKCVKMASKGVRLTSEDILMVASGGKVTWKKDAPTFSLSQGTKFMTRDIQMLP